MRFLFVPNKIGGDSEFFFVNIGAGGEIEVVCEELQLIHLQRRRSIGESGKSQVAILWMFRRAPGGGRSAVCGDALYCVPLIRNFVEHVGHDVRWSASHPGGSPDFAFK